MNIIPDIPDKLPKVDLFKNDTGEGTSTDEKTEKAKQKFGYLSGYVTEDESRNLGKPIQSYLPDPSDTSIMQTEDENSFKYNIDKGDDFSFEDQTHLGFELKFETDVSPLFNYGDANTTQKNSAIDFIYKYQNISEIASRQQIYNEFILQLDKIFDRTEQQSTNKTYYIETITGLEKLTAKMTNYEEDRVGVTLTEDISLRASYLAELYNNLIYSYKNQRYLIPENCLRFDLTIKISDIRVFKIPNPDYDATATSGIASQKEIYNQNPAYILYKLHDCNFEFFDSIPFNEGISVAGFDAMDSGPKNLTFNIKYKSISKEFKSPLINNSLFLSNKRTKIVNAENLQFDQLFNKQTTNEVSVDEKFRKQANDKAFQLGNLTIDPDNIQQNLTQTLANSVDAYKDKLIKKFENIRGVLIEDMKRQVRNVINVPEIYPSNVYDIDFRKLSLENFVRGLSTDLSNDLESGLDNFISGLF